MAQQFTLWGKRGKGGECSHVGFPARQTQCKGPERAAEKEKEKEKEKKTHPKKNTVQPV